MKINGYERPLEVLIVAYAFPPVGGAGVQRVTKLIKYLPRHGVNPAVLTVKNPSVPLHDSNLPRDLPPELEVIRARTLEPPYLLKQATWAAAAALPGRLTPRARLAKLGGVIARHVLLPDAQALWLPAATLALARRLREAPPDVVFITAPPFSQYLLAPVVRALSGAAVVLDYRDEWSTYRTTYEMTSVTADMTGRMLEGLLLRSAHGITTATEAFREALLSRFAWLSPETVAEVPNGYDPDDFPRPLPEPPSDRFVLTYGGTVFRHTTARRFLAGLRRFHERRPDLAKHLEVRFIGRVVETEKKEFEGSEALNVRRIAYLDHDVAVRTIAESHAVMCLLDDVKGAERTYPGKVFEIMHLGRPCLVVAPDGALSRLARRHRLGDVLLPSDVDGIAGALERMLTSFCGGTYVPRSNAVDVGRYDRAQLASEFATVFRRAADRARSSSPGNALRASREAPEPHDGGKVQYDERAGHLA